MSNPVHITPTIFLDANKNRVKPKSFGFRIWDNYDKAYDNTWEDIPESDMDVLARIVESHYHESGKRYIRTLRLSTLMIDYVHSTKTGLFIGEKWYDWEEIKHVFEG